MNTAGSDEAGELEQESTLDTLKSDKEAWKRFDFAITGFCYSQTLLVCDSDKLISTIVGEELEWFGSHGLLFMVNKLIENELEKQSLQVKLTANEASLEDEVSINKSMRSQLTRVQRTAQDTEWRLQEQVVQTGILLQNEKTLNVALQSRVSNLSAQIEHVSEIHSDNNSHFGENSAVTSPSTMTTPASTWRESRRSTGSSWGGGDNRLMRVAEKLNITPNQAIIVEDEL